MIRTGTLTFSRLVLLAALVGWAGVALGQSATQTSRAAGRWEPRAASDHQPSFRRAESSAGAWQTTRTERTQPQNASASQIAAPPKNWLTPTQAAGRAKAAKSNKNKPVKQSATRVPNPFVPPSDAEQLAAAGKPGANRARSATPSDVSSRPRVNANSSSAQVSQSAARTNANPSRNTKVAPRSPHDRVAYRPRPTTTNSNRLFDDSWIRPLKQVAYQAGAGEPEELYAPPGEESQMQMQMQGSPAMGPELQSEGEWIGSPDGVPYEGPCSDGSCGPDCEGGPMCGDDVGCCATCGREPESCYIDLAFGLHDPEACEEVRFRIPRIHTLMVNGGVHGFKGPFDRDRDSGNFGFQEGINMGFKVPMSRFGYQIGYQATQSQLSGDGDTGITDAFSQNFLTAGLFRRNRDGFQGGVVWDWLVDERDSAVTFSQLRAELGFVDCGCHEIGATVAVHLSDQTLLDEQQDTSTTFRPVDQYLLYYRMHGRRGGEGRVYAGLSDNTNGIVGADFLLPLTDCWSLQPAFTYLIPDGSGGSVGAREEAWNVGINLVWHWKGQARSCHSSPYRPLFNVADNGYMIIDNRP
jgi:hypothetical protein